MLFFVLFIEGLRRYSLLSSSDTKMAQAIAFPNDIDILILNLARVALSGAIPSKLVAYGPKS